MDLLEFLTKYWAIIIGLLTALFYYSRIRNIEVLKSRISIIYDCFDSFSHLNNAIQIWASPVVYEGQEKDKELIDIFNKIYPLALSNYYRAKILLNPNTSLLLFKIFEKIKDMNSAYAILKDIIKYSHIDSMTNPEDRKSYLEERSNYFNQSKKELPDEIQNIYKTIEIDFYLKLNGFFKTIFHNSLSKYIITLQRNLIRIFTIND